MTNVDGLLIVGMPPYTFFAGLGIVIGYTCFFIIMVTRKNYDFKKATVAFALGLIGLAIGAKLLGIISNIVALLNSGDSIMINDFLSGGLVFYGGLYGFLLFYVALLKFQKATILENLNIVTVCIPLFHSIARIGCFFAGCCYGKESASPLTILYHTSSLEAAQRIPIQLIESGVNLMLFIILLSIFFKKKKEKSLLGIYLGSYAVVRFTIEFFRGDEARGFVGVLSISQIIAIITIIGLGIHAIKRRIFNESNR